MIKNKVCTYFEKVSWLVALICLSMFALNKLTAQVATEQARQQYINLPEDSQSFADDIHHIAAPSSAIGLLSIASVEIEAAIFEGTDKVSLDNGIGRVAGTSYFGLHGNVALAGHRDSFFRNLKNIKLGDVIVVKQSNKEYVYEVQTMNVVEPTNTSVLLDSDDSTLTLITCYPFNFVGSAPQRFIVRAIKRA